MALQVGHVGTEVSGLGLWLSEIYKMELMKPFTAVRCEDESVYGLLNCDDDEYCIMILHSVKDFVLQVIWGLCGVIKCKRGLLKAVQVNLILGFH